MLIVKNDDAVLTMWENVAPQKQNVYITNVVYTLYAAFSNERHFSTAIKSTDTGGNSLILSLGSETYSSVALDNLFKVCVLQHL